MNERGAALRRVIASPCLRRLQLAFFLFGAAEYGVWLAILVYAYQRSGTAAAGVIAMVQLLPAAAIAPLLARAVDRYGGARVLVGGYIVQAFALGLTAAALLLALSPVVVYAGAVVAASAVTSIRPAQWSLLPELVSEPADLTAANAVTGWVENVSELAGPLLAGVAIAVDGPGGAVVLFAAGLAAATVLSAGLLRTEGTPDDDAAPEGEETGAPDLSVLATLRAEPGVPVILLMIAVQFVALGALDVLEVVLAVKTLGLGASGAGYLSAGYGVGGVLGAAGSLALVGSQNLVGKMMLTGCAAGVALAALGVWPTVAGAFALLGAMGASRAMLDVCGRTLLHRLVPEAVRGRVFGVLEGLTMLGLAIGSIAVPALVDAGGVTAALVGIGGALTVAAVAAGAKLHGSARIAPPPAPALAALRRTTLFNGLDEPVLEDLARALIPQAFQTGERIVSQGEPGTRFYLVDAGHLEVTVDGRPVRTVGPGDGFGEIALLHDGLRTGTVTGARAGRVFALEREPFLAALTSSRAAHRAMHALARHRLETTDAAGSNCSGA